MATMQLEPENTHADRDAKGRFCSGNKGGPGNPHARHMGELRKSLLEADEKDLLQVIRSVIAKAKSGDVAAAKLVLQYTLGTPRAMPDPDRLDVEEWKLLQESGLAPEVVVAQCEAVPVKEALASPMANASNGGAAPGNSPMANGSIGADHGHLPPHGVVAPADLSIANGSNGDATTRTRASGPDLPKANASIGDKRRKKKKPPGRRRKRG